MSLTGQHAERLRAGTPAAEVLDDLRRLARTHLARTFVGEPLVFRLLHGDPEWPADVLALQRLRETAGRALLFVQGGNDWTDFYLTPGCTVTLLAMDGVAREWGASWWRWTTDGTRPRIEVPS